MTWAGRKLPSNWGTLRLAVFSRDNWTCVDCGYRNVAAIGLECDHTGHPDDNRLTALATRCTPCHAKRTRAQSLAARSAMPRAKRDPERHPGLS